MKLLMFFSLFSAILAVGLSRRGLLKTQGKGYPKGELSRFFKDSLAGTFNVKTASGSFAHSSIEDCALNMEWNTYFGKALQNDLNMPESLKLPRTCPMIWLYTLHEDQIKHYLNMCLRTAKLKFSLGHEPANKGNLALNNVISFYNALTEEVKFRGSCDTSLSPRETQEKDFEVLRCTGRLTTFDLARTQYLYAKSFVSASFGDKCQTEGEQRLHFGIRREMRSSFGRDVERFSAHRGDQEFLILPGGCFKKSEKGKGNDFYYVDALPEDCVKNKKETIAL